MSKIQVDRELVRKVADLAQLSLSDPEIGLYQERLSKVLSYVEQLNSVHESLGQDWRPDTARGVPGSSTPERADLVSDSLPVEEAMKQAPARIGTAFQVPRIIE
jgi:aspartyl-tRNA(Asn)/glutamyl-tRNA(Gln) amidotransferase subunit C